MDDDCFSFLTTCDFPWIILYFTGDAGDDVTRQEGFGGAILNRGNITVEGESVACTNSAEVSAYSGCT